MIFLSYSHFGNVWFGFSPMSGSDSDGNVGSKELVAAADVILATYV